jgi:hypothetical protein
MRLSQELGWSHNNLLIYNTKFYNPKILEALFSVFCLLKEYCSFSFAPFSSEKAKPVTTNRQSFLNLRCTGERIIDKDTSFEGLNTSGGSKGGVDANSVHDTLDSKALSG